MLWAAPQRRTQPTLRGGRFHTVELTTEFLVDHNNPTGYAQIVEELVRDGQGAWQVVRTNTLGLDVISTSVASGDRGLTHGQGDDAPLALVYDAGGSTRGLFAAVFTSGQPFVDLTGGVEDDAASVQIYDYDAFGQLVRLSAALLGDRTSNPTTDPGGIQHWRFAVGTPNSVLTDAHAAAALTNLLYRGEQFDAHLGMQYLRARHYHLASGTFNRLDPFAGDSFDPMSLHKYGYAHGSPTVGIDPSGLFTTAEVVNNIATIANTFLRVLQFANKVNRLKSGLDTVLSVISFLQRIIPAIEVAMVTPGGPKAGLAFGERLISSVTHALGVNISQVTSLLPGIDLAFRHIGTKWHGYRSRIASHMKIITGNVIANTTKLIGAGVGKDLVLVLNVSSPPLGVPWTTIRLPDVAFGKHSIRLMTDRRAGRLFQIGLDTNGSGKDNTNILRIDYQIFQGQSLPVDDLEYHAGPNSPHYRIP